MKIFLLLLLTAATCNCTKAFSQIKVGNTLTFSGLGSGGLSSAEACSIIIPPGLRPDCPKGRILISRDFSRPPNTGAVVYRDLDKPFIMERNATFNNAPVADFTGNDHDLLLLPNGDILYVTAATSTEPLNPKPWWFDSTFRDNTGPGTRSSMLTWRSTDGGKTFQYLSRYDPAKVETGIPAFPQFRRDSKQNLILSPKWDMGGTDGPLTKSIPGTDQLYMATMIVGYGPQPGHGTLKGMLIPDETNPIGQTVLLTSKAGGTWSSLGRMEGSWWRLGMVPYVDKDKVPAIIFAPGLDNGLFTGFADGASKFAFTTSASRPSQPWGWTNWSETNLPTDGVAWSDGKRNSKILSKRIWSNIWAHTVISRCSGPGNNALVVYPSTIDGLNGCAVYFYNEDNGQFQDARPILPEGGLPTDCILHPTIIDTKTGPLMVYWYDLNSKTLKAKIRGRIIERPGDYSPDFDVSLVNNQPYSFNLKNIKSSDPTNHPEDTLSWYGDYHTADGYNDSVVSTNGKDSVTAHFFPFWVQPDSTLHYAEVTYKYRHIGKQLNPVLPNRDVQVWPRPLVPWKKPLSRVDLKKMSVDQQLRVRSIGEKEILQQTKGTEKLKGTIKVRGSQ